MDNGGEKTLNERIAELKQKSEEAKKTKRETAALLKAAVRKKSKLVKKAKSLADEDLMSIYRHRQELKAAAAAAAQGK